MATRGGADDCPTASPSLVSSSHIKIEPTGVINLRVERRSPPLPPPPPPLLPLCPIPIVPHLAPPVIQPQLMVQHCLPPAMSGPSTSRMSGGGGSGAIDTFTVAGPSSSRPMPHINMVPDLRAIPLSHRLQPDEEDTSGDTENDSLDDSSTSSSNSDTRSPNGTLLPCPDQEMVSEQPY